MTTQLFIEKAMANKQTLQHITIAALAPAEMELHLDAKCVCCEGEVAIHAVEEWSDHGDHMHMQVTGWACDVFCDGCQDNIPANILYRYGVISRKECDELLNWNEEYSCDDDLPF